MTRIFLRKPPQQHLQRQLNPGDALSESIHSVVANDPPLHHVLSGEQPLVLIFVRHSGCPFAERDVKAARRAQAEYPQARYCLVTHGDQALTERWLQQIGGVGEVLWYHDAERRLHGAFGLGYSSAWHFMGWRSLLGVIRLWPQGIRNRIATGTRWQKSGVFVVTHQRLIWCRIASSAEQNLLPDGSVFKEGA